MQGGKLDHVIVENYILHECLPFRHEITFTHARPPIFVLQYVSHIHVALLHM